MPACTRVCVYTEALGKEVMVLRPQAIGKAAGPRTGAGRSGVGWDERWFFPFHIWNPGGKYVEKGLTPQLPQTYQVWEWKTGRSSNFAPSRSPE